MLVIIFYLILGIFTLAIAVQVVSENMLKSKKDCYRGSVMVIVPIREVDPNIAENIISLKNQSYPNYDLIYIADIDDKDTLEVLKKYEVHVILSENLCKECSGKIRAMLTGLHNSDSDAVVFADSDVYYPPNWLEKLVCPLSFRKISTTYAWPYPLEWSWSNIIRSSIWLLGFEPSFLIPLVWGGSVAMRREFITNDLEDRLKHRLCDDCVFTSYAREIRERVQFVIDAMPVNYFDERDLHNWAGRQVAYTINYYKDMIILFLISFIIYSSGIILGIFLLNPFFIFFPLLWTLKNSIRGRKLYPKSLIISALSSLLFFSVLYYIIESRRQKTIKWRGNEYEKENI